MAITHDRYFLDNVAGWILELDRGEGIPWKGNYSSGWSRKISVWRRKPLRKRRAVKSIEKSWSGYARARKAVRGLRARPVWRALKSLTTSNIRSVTKPTNCLFRPSPSGEIKLLKSATLRKSYGDRVLIDDLTFSGTERAIVGIIGPNGAGKSTLFRMMSGQGTA